MIKFCECINIEYCFILDKDVYIKIKKENEIFEEFFNWLVEEKNIFVWKEGELEDFFLDGDDVFMKIKNILG